MAFEELWNNRQRVTLAPGAIVHLPRIDDLILTKRFADRAKDLEDIRLLLPHDHPPRPWQRQSVALRSLHAR